MIGKYVAIIVCALCVAACVSLSLGIGFIFGSGVGFIVFSALCCVMHVAALLFALRVAREAGGAS